MGCPISRPRAPSEHSESGPNYDAKRHRKCERGRESGAPQSRDESCDYATATSGFPDPERKGRTRLWTLEVGAENINQAAAAQAPVEQANNKRIDLGQCSAAASERPVLADDKRYRMSPGARKRQRQTGAASGSEGQHELASRLLMFVPRRRQSAMRTDATRAPKSSANSLVSAGQSGHQVVSNGLFPISLNFLRPPSTGAESSAKRKLNSSPQQQLSQLASMAPLDSPLIVHEPVAGTPNGPCEDQSSSAWSEQSCQPERKLKGADDVILFTSLQQLCYEILNRKLRQAMQQHREAESKLARERVLCLFVFGRPGSNKGELAYDLVEHSSLVDLLGDRERLEKLVNECEADEERCPVFHYIDVSALIVDNIDERIREYNKLMARTLRERRGQLALVATRQESEELDQASETRSLEAEARRESSADTSAKQEANSGSNSNSVEIGDAEKKSCSPKSNGTLPSDRAANRRDLEETRRASLEHQFGILTLTTKQRSILQLKLMKYANCVSAKWITILIKQEINKLERRLRRSLAELGHWATLLAKLPSRIYLINLVPNQLSLFRSCLYLEQGLCLSDFHRAIYAIKFERRTNIRVLRKERGVKRAEQQQQERKLALPSKSFQFKLAHMKISNLVGPSLSKSSSHESLVMPETNATRDACESLQSLGSLSSELLSGVANEKLGPKFNETFAGQFKSCERLLKVRFNPVEHTRGSPLSSSSSPPTCTGSASCCAKLTQQIESYDNTPLPSPSPSSLVSMFAASNNKRPAQQQSASFEHLNLVAGAAGSELSGSSSSSLIDLNRLLDGSSTISSTVSGKTVALKWAIELQLVAEPEGANHEVGASECSDRKASLQQHPLELHTFQPARASSRSPLMFAAADRYQQLLGASGHHAPAEGYALVPTRVAYANGACQTILEVKKVQRRCMKFKSRQDVARLLKLIERSRRQLIEDLDGWLAASIAAESGKLQRPNSDLQQRLAVLIPAARRQPALVTQVIRVDLSQFKRDNSSTCEPAIDYKHPLGEPSNAKVARRPVSAVCSRLRPSLKVRPASSLSNEESISNSGTKQAEHGQRAKRHVQFRIDPTEEERSERALLGPTQRRLWINECLFASCSHVELLACMNNFVTLLK